MSLLVAANRRSNRSVSPSAPFELYNYQPSCASPNLSAKSAWTPKVDSETWAKHHRNFSTDMNNTVVFSMHHADGVHNGSTSRSKTRIRIHPVDRFPMEMAGSPVVSAEHFHGSYSKHEYADVRSRRHGEQPHRSSPAYHLQHYHHQQHHHAQHHHAQHHPQQVHRHVTRPRQSRSVTNYPLTQPMAGPGRSSTRQLAASSASTRTTHELTMSDCESRLRRPTKRSSSDVSSSSPSARRWSKRNDPTVAPASAWGSVGQRFATNFAETLRHRSPAVPAQLFLVPQATQLPAVAGRRQHFMQKNLSNVGKVKVMLRLCPSGEPMSHFVVDPSQRQLKVLADPDSGFTVPSQRAKQVSAAPKLFNFDQIFLPDCDMAHICSQSLIDVLHGVINGCDGCVFTYGHCTAAKNETMLGNSNQGSMGLILCAISWLFALVNEQRGRNPGARFSIRVSAVEVSGQDERLSDLLANFSRGQEPAPGVYLRDDPVCGTQVENQSELRVPSAESAAYFLDAALSARQSASTGSSTNSSDADEVRRASHMIFTLHVYQYRVEKSATEVAGGRSRLHLINLGCGSRSASATANSSTTQAMNLQTLGLTIMALINGRRNIPNGQSKLGHLLRDALGGHNCNVAMLVHVSSAVSAYQDSVQLVQMAAKLHRARNRQKMKNRLGGANSSDDSSSCDDQLRLGQSRRRNGIRMGTGRYSDPDYSSSSEQSCDTVIYLGASSRSTSDFELTDGERPPSLASGRSNLTTHSAPPARSSSAGVGARPAPGAGPKLGKKMVGLKRPTGSGSETETWVDGPKADQQSNVPTNAKPATESTTTKANNSNDETSTSERWIDGPNSSWERRERERIAQLGAVQDNSNESSPPPPPVEERTVIGCSSGETTVLDVSDGHRPVVSDAPPLERVNSNESLRVQSYRRKSTDRWMAQEVVQVCNSRPESIAGGAVPDFDRLNSSPVGVGQSESKRQQQQQASEVKPFIRDWVDSQARLVAPTGLAEAEGNALSNNRIRELKLETQSLLQSTPLLMENLLSLQEHGGAGVSDRSQVPNATASKRPASVTNSPMMSQRSTLLRTKNPRLLALDERPVADVVGGNCGVGAVNGQLGSRMYAAQSQRTAEWVRAVNESIDIPHGIEALRSVFSASLEQKLLTLQKERELNGQMMSCSVDTSVSEGLSTNSPGHFSALSGTETASSIERVWPPHGADGQQSAGLFVNTELNKSTNSTPSCTSSEAKMSKMLIDNNSCVFELRTEEKLENLEAVSICSSFGVQSFNAELLNPPPAVPPGGGIAALAGPIADTKLSLKATTVRSFSPYDNIDTERPASRTNLTSTTGVADTSGTKLTRRPDGASNPRLNDDSTVLIPSAYNSWDAKFSNQPTTTAKVVTNNVLSTAPTAPTAPTASTSSTPPSKLPKPVVAVATSAMVTESAPGTPLLSQKKRSNVLKSDVLRHVMAPQDLVPVNSPPTERSENVPRLFDRPNLTKSPHSSRSRHQQRASSVVSSASTVTPLQASSVASSPLRNAGKSAVDSVAATTDLKSARVNYCSDSELGNGESRRRFKWTPGKSGFLAKMFRRSSSKEQKMPSKSLASIVTPTRTKRAPPPPPPRGGSQSDYSGGSSVVADWKRQTAPLAPSSSSASAVRPSVPVTTQVRSLSATNSPMHVAAAGFPSSSSHHHSTSGIPLFFGRRHTSSSERESSPRYSVDSVTRSPGQTSSSAGRRVRYSSYTKSSGFTYIRPSVATDSDSGVDSGSRVSATSPTSGRGSASRTTFPGTKPNGSGSSGVGSDTSTVCSVTPKNPPPTTAMPLMSDCFHASSDDNGAKHYGPSHLGANRPQVKRFLDSNAYELRGSRRRSTKGSQQRRVSFLERIRTSLFGGSSSDSDQRDCKLDSRTMAMDLLNRQEQLKTELAQVRALTDGAAASHSTVSTAPNLWSVELPVAEGFAHSSSAGVTSSHSPWSDRRWLEALRQETEALQRRVDTCKSNIMMVTCFDANRSR